MTTPPSSQLTRGYITCVFATLLWASAGVLIRYLTETFALPPLVLAFWRDVMISLALLGLFAVARPSLLQVGRQNLRFLAAYGFVVAVFNSLWTISVALNGAAVATVLAYSSAAFTAVLGRWLLQEKLGVGKMIAVSISLLGCVLVSGAYDPAAWQLNPTGILTGLASGILFAIYSLIGRVSAGRGINPWSALAYSFFAASIFLLGFNLGNDLLFGKPLLAELGWLGSQWSGWGVLLFLALVPTAGGFGLYTVSLGYLPASVANLIATLEPALTAGLAYLVLGEVLNPMQLLGSGLIVTSVLLLRITASKGE